MVNIQPNANFHSLGGTSAPERQSEEYMEYRRCWTEYPSNFVLRDFPIHLDIEITSRCNLSCPFCDRQPLLAKKELGDIELGLYKKIVDEARDNKLWGLKLSYRGEPLLHKDVVEMVAYAKKNRILDVYFNTNGMLLNERICKRLIDAGLDRISISIEGTEASAYEKMRIGGKFDAVIRNIDMLMELKKKMNVSHPKVRVQSVNYAGFDMDEYRRFWLRHSDEVAMLDFTDMTNRKKGLSHGWACPQLWQRMTIHWDGPILPCNNDYDCLLVVGNVKDRTVRECWHDKGLAAIRSLHREGRSCEVKACDGCPWRAAQIQKSEVKSG